eukprot:11217353-Lingulodinium_polyedra.AAC.1
MLRASYWLPLTCCLPCARPAGSYRGRICNDRCPNRHVAPTPNARLARTPPRRRWREHPNGQQLIKRYCHCNCRYARCQNNTLRPSCL